MIRRAKPLFELGKLVATRGALEALNESGQEPRDFIGRHLTGDWGECNYHDAQVNEQALADGSRVFSVYRTSRGTKLWVITEADRTSTCILLPAEY